VEGRWPLKPSSFFILFIGWPSALLDYNYLMPTVRFPAVMKYYVNNQAEFSISASTARELLEKIIQQYPTIKFHLVDTDGNLRRHFNVFVNGTHIRDLNGMETALKEEDKVILMASAAGGRTPVQD
jgi:molybdopterin converting factor small subunit